MTQVRGIAVLGALVVSMGVAVTPVATAQADEPVVRNAVTADERADAVAYWTPERMRAAALDDQAPPTGPASQPWDGGPVPTVGKLFFRTEKGVELLDSYCSATSIGGPDGDTVLTAAHCLTRPGTVYGANTSLVFVPGYRDGTAPFGVFPVRVAAYPEAFTTVEQQGQDIGAVVVDPVGGRSLAETVGAQDVAVGDDAEQALDADVTVLGYPMSNPELGSVLMSCASRSVASPLAQSVRTDCDLTRGTSGGPWVVGIDPGDGEGTVVSVSSSSGTVDALDGPLLDETAVAVLAAVRAEG